MKRNSLLQIIALFVLLVGCNQSENKQDKIAFSNDYLIGQFASQKGGEAELMITKKGNEFVLQQLIEDNKWSEEEKLSPITDDKMEEAFGTDWKDKVSAGLTSGMCSYYRLQPGIDAGGITTGEVIPTEYLSRCFADNYLYKIN
ncbi:MAG: hypothetical protein KY428_11250 [Bacteroidetes bacterium]|nr:hypothetical protein [Bacteroidota bacterium]